MRLPLAFLCAALATGCQSAPGERTPSLATRAAESIDPRVPVLPSVVAMPADAGLTARLRALVEQAQAGDAAFRAAAEAAERLARAAGRAGSESWVLAQQALSAAVAARGPTTRALGDVDALGASALHERGGLSPADLAAVESAASALGALDQAQAARISAVQARLGG